MTTTGGVLGLNEGVDEEVGEAGHNGVRDLIGQSSEGSRQDGPDAAISRGVVIVAPRRRRGRHAGLQTRFNIVQILFFVISLAYL